MCHKAIIGILSSYILFLLLDIITHYILFVTLEVITASVVNQDTGTINYVLNENAGIVTVCLMKDLVTAEDFIVTFIAQEKTPPDALCKIELLNNNYM